jgi:septum site-determining protein MinC
MVSMLDNLIKTTAFKLKGRLYTFTVMHLLTTDVEAFKAQLQQTISSAPKLFQHIPVVLDCSTLGETEFDLQAFCQCLQANQVIPVAIQGGNAWLTTVAQCQGLAVLTSSSMQDKPPIEEKKPSNAMPTKLHDAPVRSGQQIVAREGDLVVIASVSPGAELLADGNIYVYGALRGRALAGINGNVAARIFCQSLEAELIAINGVYRLNESMEALNSPCQIYLADGRIVIEPIAIVS